MTDAQQKALRLLGLARRARLLQIGEEPVGIACRSGKASSGSGPRIMSRSVSKL